ncbi:MAG TPA: N-acetylmuramoyl-L-alanine amidase [Acidobacteriaceae bacterium]|nr:N-acetylmuramoyl-L-alanine amidase [Acidobacteriaceae bacterium]
MPWTEPLALLFIAMTASALGQAPQQRASPATTPQSAPPAPALPQAPASALQLPAPAAKPLQAAFVVVLDPAHGGSDTGAHLGNNLEEKEVTLALSDRLRSELLARGIAVVTTRTADVLIPPVARAESANRAQAAACLVIHATATGSGVHLYTSSLAPGPMTRPLPWQSAQSAYVTQSVKLESEINAALAHAQIPLTLGRASVQPIDSLACPAVAIELAPLVGGHVTKPRDIGDSAYQKSVVDALSAAIESWQSDWKH